MKGSLSVDVLGRLAVLKFLRAELHHQFSQVLEQCRMMIKSLDGLRQQAGMAQRERVASYQVRKKITIRKTGQDIVSNFARDRKRNVGAHAPLAFR